MEEAAQVKLLDRNSYLIIVAVAVVLVAALALSCQEKAARVCFGENCVNVEVASTPGERETGLMGRESLETGMLFIFPREGSYRFWMKGTLVPLDMVWISGNGTVVFVQENARPCGAEPCETFGPPEAAAMYVLELNSGTAGVLGAVPGTKASISMA